VDERRRLRRVAGKVICRMENMRLWAAFGGLVDSVSMARRAQDARVSASGLAVTLKLDLDFSVAGSEGSRERASFQKQVVDDLACAVGCSSDCFRVQSMSAGSVNVHMIIIDSEEDDDEYDSEPSQVLASLQKQVTDQGSRLRSGVFTSKVLSLTADDEEYLRPPGFNLAFSMPRLPKLTGLVASQPCTPALIDAATARNNQLEYLRKRAQQRQQRSLKPIETPPTQKVQEQGAHFTCERASVRASVGEGACGMFPMRAPLMTRMNYPLSFHHRRSITGNHPIAPKMDHCCIFLEHHCGGVRHPCLCADVPQLAGHREAVAWAWHCTSYAAGVQEA